LREYKITATGNGPTDWVNLDTKGNTIHLYHIAVVFESEAAGVADVELSIEADFTTATPVCHDILQGVTSTTMSIIHAPIAGIRLNISDYTGRDITLKVLQS